MFAFYFSWDVKNGFFEFKCENKQLVKAQARHSDLISDQILHACRSKRVHFLEYKDEDAVRMVKKPTRKYHNTERMREEVK